MNSTNSGLIRHSYLIVRSILLALAFSLVLPISSLHANGSCYLVESNVLTDDRSCSGQIVIDNSVTAIGPRAFLDNHGLISVVIPDSAVSVGDYAFFNTINLETLTLGSSLKSIGTAAFQNQKKLTSLTIPDSVETIDTTAFYGIESVTSLTIGSGVSVISHGAFGNPTSLTSLTIPNTVTRIESEAFISPLSLVSLTLGNSLTSIGVSAFENPRSLTSLVIPNSVTTIGNYAFKFFETDLRSLTLGNSIRTIGIEAFSGAALITSLTIPDSVVEISIGAFAGVNSLNSLTLGNSIETIPAGAFSGAENLVSLRIPDSVKVIGNQAFFAYKKLESLTLGKGVEVIGEQAFNYANSLTSLTIPKSVTSIGANAFSGSPLQELRLEGDPIIGANAFSGLAEDAKIFVPIGANAFSGPEWSDYEITYFSPTPNRPNIPTYQVSYFGNSADASSVSVDYAGYANGEKVIVVPRAPVRPGYTFLGWNTAENGSGTSYSPGSSLSMGSANVSLYAQWKINSYTLTLNENSGANTKSNSLVREFGSSYLIPALSAEQLRPGYTFLGWNSAANGSGQNYLPAASFKFTSDTTLYAQWKINNYSLRYDGNGQQVGRLPANTNQEFGSSLKVQAPSKIFTRKGYTFNNWNSSPDGTGVSYAPGAVITQPATDLTLYANWLANTYQVRFLSSSKEAIPNGQFTTGGRILSAPTPAARAGYTFKGWSNTPARTQILSFPYTPIANRNISLYAVWEKKK